MPWPEVVKEVEKSVSAKVGVRGKNKRDFGILTAALVWAVDCSVVFVLMQV